MKKILLIILAIVMGSIGFYYIYARDVTVEKLKAQVDRQLQILSDNGFGIEERNITKRREHFVLNYRDAQKISDFLQSKNIDISPEDSAQFQGMKIAVDIRYLKGIFNALAMDIYPVDLPEAHKSEISDDDRKVIDKILNNRLLLLHLDMDALFGSFDARLQDIDTVIQGEDPYTAISKGLIFSGRLGDDGLWSSTLGIDQLLLQTQSGFYFGLKKLTGVYNQIKSVYNYESKYEAESFAYWDEQKRGILLEHPLIKASSKELGDTLRVNFGLQIEKSKNSTPYGVYFLEDIEAEASVNNISKTAIMKLNEMETNNTISFNDVLLELMTQKPEIIVKRVAIDKMREETRKELIDGFSMSGKIHQIADVDPQALEEDPSLLLDLIAGQARIELSTSLYTILQKRPEFSIAMMFLRPEIKNNKVLFDVIYQNSTLKINGRSLL